MTASLPAGLRGGQGNSETIRRRPVRAIKVYWPVSRETLASVAGGRVDELRNDLSFAPLLGVLETASLVGDFGAYTEVFEVGIGVEGFTTGPGASPTLGQAGERTLSPTLSVTVHVDGGVSEHELSGILARIAAAHPWEVPVMELSGPMELISRG